MIDAEGNEVDPPYSGGWPQGYDSWHAYFIDYRLAQIPSEEPVKAARTVVKAAHEVSLDTVLKYTQKGEINTQSTLGKVAKSIVYAGGEIKAGSSTYIYKDDVHEWEWLDGVINGHRVMVNSEGCQWDYQWLKVKELIEKIEEQNGAS